MAKSSIVERNREDLWTSRLDAEDRIKSVMRRLRQRSRPDNDLSDLLAELDLAITDFSSAEAYLYHLDQLRSVLDDIFPEADDPNDGVAVTAAVGG